MAAVAQISKPASIGWAYYDKKRSVGSSHSELLGSGGVGEESCFVGSVRTCRGQVRWRFAAGTTRWLGVREEACSVVFAPIAGDESALRPS